MLKAKGRKNLTEGPIFSRLLLFVIPIVLTGVLQVMYSMADNIVVGRFSGDPNALGAVGSAISLSVLVVNILLNIAAGAGVTVQDVNQLIRQFEQTRQMVKQMMGSKKGAMRRMASMNGMNRPPFR